MNKQMNEVQLFVNNIIGSITHSLNNRKAKFLQKLIFKIGISYSDVFCMVVGVIVPILIAVVAEDCC